MHSFEQIIRVVLKCKQILYKQMTGKYPNEHVFSNTSQELILFQIH